MAGHKQAGHDVCERRSGGRLTGLRPRCPPGKKDCPTAHWQGLCRLLVQLLFPLQRQPPLRDVTSARRCLPGAVCDGLRAPRGDPLRHRGRQLGQAASRPSRWTAANAAARLIQRPGDTGRLRRPANRTEHAWPPRRPLTRPTHTDTARGSGGEATDLDTGERLIRLRRRDNPVSPGPLRLRIFVGPSPMPTTLIGALTRGHRTHENTPPTRRLVQRLTPPSSTRSGPTWWPATATQHRYEDGRSDAANTAPPCPHRPLARPVRP